MVKRVEVSKMSFPGWILTSNENGFCLKRIYMQVDNFASKNTLFVGTSFCGNASIFCKQFLLRINSLRGLACLSANKAIGTINPCTPLFLSKFKDNPLKRR